MNGIVIVNKPQDFTSFDVVAKVRGISGVRKVGHGGTLDPMATGVLPVFIGRATKAVDLQPDQSKVYEAELLFGLQTDTGDITGTVLEEQAAAVTAADVKAVLPRFKGEQTQLPPMYSAVKVDGKPLYAYARQGQSAPRKERGVTIYSIDYQGETAPNRHALRVHCSAGTYIRTLAEDIGKALGVPATLAALERTAAGVFTLSQAVSLDFLQRAQDGGTLAAQLHPIEAAFTQLPVLQLPAKEARFLCNGAPFTLPQQAPGRYRALDDNGFLGVAQVDDAHHVKAEKVFVHR